MYLVRKAIQAACAAAKWDGTHSGCDISEIKIDPESFLRLRAETAALFGDTEDSRRVVRLTTCTGIVTVKPEV